MIVQVYKCPHTGQLFEMDKKKEYDAHLARYNRGQKRIAHAAHIVNTFQSWLAEEKKKIVSIDMIAPWIIENTECIVTMYNKKHGKSKSSWERQFKEGTPFRSLEITNTRYDKSVSNSHSCPRGGTTNWGGMKKDEPRGYPGWTGRISGSFGDDYKSLGDWSALFKLVDIHTGTGGGSQNFSYGVEIFLSDWPELAQALTVNKLLGV